jgi:hypothetical protein
MEVLQCPTQREEGINQEKALTLLGIGRKKKDLEFVMNIMATLLQIMGLESLSKDSHEY